MTITSQVQNTGVIVRLDSHAQRAAEEEVARRRKNKSKDTIGDVLADIVTKVVTGEGVILLEGEVVNSLKKMLKDKQVSNPALTFNRMCVDILSDVASEYAKQHPSVEDLPPQQISGCAH